MNISRIKKHKLVEMVSDERNNENGIWVYLKMGWINEYSGTHCIHEDTPKEVWDQFSWCVPCSCDECKGEAK